MWLVLALGQPMNPFAEIMTHSHASFTATSMYADCILSANDVVAANNAWNRKGYMAKS